MMRWVVGTSLKLRHLVVVAASMMMFFGVGQFRDMPVDVFPEFAPPRVEIQTSAIGLSAAEVEALGRVEPKYEVLRGWNRPTGVARKLSDLLSEARAYLDRLEELSGVPVRYVSVGTRRDQIIETGKA